MLFINKQKFLTYIAIILLSCAVFLTFFLSVNQNVQSEQTYEMTDHEIHQKDTNKLDDNFKDKQNTEQKKRLCSHW
ncbi:putative secreted protein [Staphylococcus saccharolyticus]|uniref:Putative secreted protein n=1 Tax=Staphylococcus saccharolyticus TaxID=33028 RepID=A0A380H698_9STAP|nr:putative secreted protein [Staphylococcus saccharolyticus]